MLYELLILYCVGHPPSLLRLYDLPHYWIAMLGLNSCYETSNKFLLLNRRESYDVGPIAAYFGVTELISCIVFPICFEVFELLIDLIHIDSLIRHEDVVLQQSYDYSC